MDNSVCPWWLGYLLACPVRKLINNPDKIVGPFVKPGMKIIDYGSGMGYFSLPMAKMVGNTGKVFCFDIQEKMLEHLVDKAEKAGIKNIIEPRLITDGSEAYKNMEQVADFGLLYAVAHEVPDRGKLFITLASMIKPKGRLLFAEPQGHVTHKDFEESVALAEKAGFIKVDVRPDKKCFSILLEKKE
jgi:ubiquinone/menaquinone biosynthesis C-methylase UbiE